MCSMDTSSCGMQCSATPKGRSFAQTLPRVSVLGFKEGSGNQTTLTNNYNVTSSKLASFPDRLRPENETRVSVGVLEFYVTYTL